MSKFVRIAFWMLIGFAVGAAVGAMLISLLSGNTHDKSLEITMTSVFVAGPIGAIIGLIAGLFMTRRPVVAAADGHDRA